MSNEPKPAALALLDGEEPLPIETLKAKPVDLNRIQEAKSQVNLAGVQGDKAVALAEVLEKGRTQRAMIAAVVSLAGTIVVTVGAVVCVLVALLHPSAKDAVPEWMPRRGLLVIFVLLIGAGGDAARRVVVKLRQPTSSKRL